MPPRLRNPRVSLSPFPLTPSSQPSQTCQCISQSRSFTSSQPSNEQTKLRQTMFEWLNGPGAVFKNPLPGSTNYLSAYDAKGNLIRTSLDPAKLKQRESEESEGGDVAAAAAAAGSAAEPAPATPTSVPREQVSDLRPFPQNRDFVSQSVLSEELRLEVYKRVKIEGKSIRLVSVELGIDMRRIGAVVRLVELEKRMRAQGAKLAVPYARAVLDMLPTTKYSSNPQRQQMHEPINDLPVHSLTDPQIFHPIPEGARFTRTEAGRVFSAAPLQLNPDTHPTTTPTGEKVGKGNKEEIVLLPADARIPHPHLVAIQREMNTQKSNWDEIREKYLKKIATEDREEQAMRDHAARAQAKKVKSVAPADSRWEFRFKDVEVSKQTIGTDGRGREGPGHRYGVPHSDRKRGAVKIPTKVVV